MAHVVLGVDGWRGSWVAARLRGTTAAAELLDWHTGRFADLLRLRADVVAVDIPVGLAEGGLRRCDVQAKGRVPGASSRVFLTQPRAAYDAADLTAANRVLRARGEPGVSAQAFALRDAILEVDGAADDPRVVEVHPEVSLALIAGQPMAPKRTAQGVGQRVRALGTWVDVLAALDVVPARVPVDDALDALAAAWSAVRWAAGVAEVLGPGEDGRLDRDGRGRPMRIVV
jgi:predicted RNase H-like nuclease